MMRRWRGRRMVNASCSLLSSSTFHRRFGRTPLFSCMAKRKHENEIYDKNSWGGRHVGKIREA